MKKRVRSDLEQYLMIVGALFSLVCWPFIFALFLEASKQGH